MSQDEPVFEYIELIRRELVPAAGCTEPAAVAYAAAVAREALGAPPERISLELSGNVVKNGLTVGIPGSKQSGLDIAAAMGAIGGRAGDLLEVFRRMPEGTAEVAAAMVGEGRVSLSVKDTPKRLYIAVRCFGGGSESLVAIEDTHTGITRVEKDGAALRGDLPSAAGEGKSGIPTSLEQIWAFARDVPARELAFVGEAAETNLQVAREGLRGRYGLRVGRSMYGRPESISSKDVDSVFRAATALAAAAIDARLSGCQLSVISVCGSGSHGITATVPVIAVAQGLALGEEAALRALAVSLLVTIHVKGQLGRLSPICGCGVAASIGASCAITQLLGGDFAAMCRAVNNMVADVSGMICDGGKPGCALKIATAVNSACRNARLALEGISATPQDGIVAESAEQSIRNLSRLGGPGMASADPVILSILLEKCS